MIHHGLLLSDDDDMRFSGSRSRRFVLICYSSRSRRTFSYASKSRRQESDADEHSDPDRHSTSRSKSRKKSSKTVRSPKRRSRSVDRMHFFTNREPVASLDQENAADLARPATGSVDHARRPTIVIVERRIHENVPGRVPKIVIIEAKVVARRKNLDDRSTSCLV